MVSGSVYHDSVQFGVPSAALSTTGLFTAYDHDWRDSTWFADNTFRQSEEMTGIMGLGLNSPEVAPPLFGELVAASGSRNVFGLCLDDQYDAVGELDASSSLDLGGANPSKFSGDLQYVLLVNGSDLKPGQSQGHYWISQPTGLGVVAADGTVTAPAATEISDGFCIDSGAPGVILPEVIATPLFSTVRDYFEEHQSECQMVNPVTNEVLAGYGCEDLLFASDPKRKRKGVSLSGLA